MITSNESTATNDPDRAEDRSILMELLGETGVTTDLSLEALIDRINERLAR
ncbi:MAG: hypothetical protein AAGC81_15595 [Pseudomonadota bacterium]